MFNGDGMLDPSEFMTLVMGACAAIITISQAVSIVVNAIKKIKEPETVQNSKLEEISKKIDVMDARFKVHEEFFDKDNRRINAIEEGNRITQKAILALMTHAIDGNNIKQLTEAKDALNDYLINK